MTEKKLESRMEKRKKKKKKPGKRKYIVITVFSVLLLLAFGVSFYGFSLLNKVTTNKISEKPEDIGIKPEVVKQLEESGKADDVINIALYGTDQLDVNEQGRSDFIMILTVDKAHKKIKMSSIMRDSYVNINGHGSDKINHAYAYGGPQLALRTLNENFNMNIKDYVTVNFFSLEKIIDNLGGLVIDVKASDLQDLNLYIVEMCKATNRKPALIPKAGSQKLNGIQAVAYVRNRSWGKGDDFERSERQRKVLAMIFDKIQAAGPLKYPSIIGDLMPYVSTSFTKTDIVKLAADVATSGIKTLSQDRFPVDGYYNGTMIKDVYYLKYDSKATIDQMHKYIFDDIKPVPKQ